MEESKGLNHLDEFSSNNTNELSKAIKNKEKDSNSITNENIDKNKRNIDRGNDEITNEKSSEVSKLADTKANPNAVSNIKKNNSKDISTSSAIKAKTKPVKAPPIEKKPFLEFINDYLIPEIKNEFKLKGKQVNKINLQKTNRPIAEDICWVIYCEINDTCNFWLSFEKDDISSLKSFSLCKNYEKPSIIESFLIDEKKITLKLIISRILQRLNGQKLIGAN